MYSVNDRRAFRPLSLAESKLFFDDRDSKPPPQEYLCRWAGDTESITLVQAHLRCILAKRFIAVTLQQKEARRIEELRVAETERAIVVVQRFCEAQASLSLLLRRIPRKIQAARNIQKWWRHGILSGKLKWRNADYLDEDDALASFVPTCISALAAEQSRRRKNAALKIASWAARLLRRRREVRAKIHRAVFVIIRAFRLFKLKRIYFLRKREKIARLKLLMDEELQKAREQEMTRRREAALVIYYFYLRYRSRSILQHIDAIFSKIKGQPDRSEAARTIQNFWWISRTRLQLERARRFSLEIREVTAREETIIYAATVIQTKFRQYSKRYVLNQRRELYKQNRNAAAIVIQTMWRKILAKDLLWGEKMRKLSMYKELLRLRQIERTRASAVPIRSVDPQAALPRL
jgi:hypothetical protein